MSILCYGNLIANEILVQGVSVLKCFFQDLRVIARKLANSFSHQTQVRTKVQLAATCNYLRVRSSKAWHDSLDGVVQTKGLKMFFQDLRVIARKLANSFSHQTQVRTKVQLAATCNYLRVRSSKAWHDSLDGVVQTKGSYWELRIASNGEDASDSFVDLCSSITLFHWDVSFTQFHQNSFSFRNSLLFLISFDDNKDFLRS